jgi:ceramide glucosyltransferase
MKTWLLAIPVAVCVAGPLYQWLGALLAARWLDESHSAPESLPPVTLLRPLKAGVPALSDKLDRLVGAMRPGDQLVLGASEGSEELALCEALVRDFSDLEIVAVPCREGAAVNPKISKLVQMDSAVRHERWILSDSETLVDRLWLDTLRGEWETSGADVLTTAYRFVGARTWPQRCDAAATLLSLWPGLALVRRWGRIDFTLGACTALRRTDLAAVGGWKAFGDFLAEDRQLGAALAAAGRRIRLATAVASLDIDDPLTAGDWWRHQRRVALTYRVSAPAGFAGTILTHSATAALFLGLCGHPFAAILTYLLRWLAARRLAAMLGFPASGLVFSQLAAGLLETVTWALSWLPGRVWWSGRWWSLDRRGRLRAGNP